MEKINFIGAYDKTDSIMYIAKILTEMKKKVIIVDATITQKTKYVIPTIKIHINPNTTLCITFFLVIHVIVLQINILISSTING